MLEEWLVPIVLFWAVAAVYFGGLEHEVSGGSGFRQFIGLVLAYVFFLIIWGVAHAFVLRDTTIGVVVACAIAVVLFPVAVRLGFLIIGGRIHRHSSAAH